jgi:hypothetical protein
LLTNLQWSAKNQIIAIISYILWWFDTKIIGTFSWMLSIFKFISCSLKDCAPQQENSNNRHFLVRLVAKNIETNPLYWMKITKVKPKHK